MKKVKSLKKKKTFDFRVVGVLKKKPNLEWQEDHKILIPNAYEKILVKYSTCLLKQEMSRK
ncbi:hypothetical protein BsIDN1_53230 [Bacillus safensis]|uniref:Uncharacterized protein n=1 Tax=Bacillus safensis TaxID=561879 RepID=A0A5S9MG07_BACIA|nr:hypothetical protein BsIDN1_53230 [Bacillus safensis]